MIATSIQESAEPSAATGRAVALEFRRLLLDGAELRVVGESQDNPESLLDDGYVPRFKVELFGTTFFVSRPRQIPELRFMVGYVMPPAKGSKPRQIFARIFYKDLSLIWRVASHVVAKDGDLWIGKGDVQVVRSGGYEHFESLESTTDLPFEVQSAFESFNRQPQKIIKDEQALYRVLRNARNGRIEPFADFTGPRRRAAKNPKNLIHGGRRIARFKKKNDPRSLTFVSGYEPDFRDGIVERSSGSSALYHGDVQRVRVLSENRKIQYLFMAGPRQVWIIPAQTLTTELSTFGVRTVDVMADDDLFVPGYEYHYVDPDVPADEHFSQIPKGFAGAPSEYSDDRADASDWLDRLSVIKQFRKQVLQRD